MNGTATLNGISKDYFAAVWERDDAEAAERMQEEHERPYKALFQALTDGRIDSFDFCGQESRNGRNWYIAARSTRPGVLVQMSVVWMREDGEMLPMSHRNINSFDDFRPEIPQNSTSVRWTKLDHWRDAA